MGKQRTGFAALAAGLLILAGSPGRAAEPVRVALTGKYPPFSFYSPDGELAGFDVDISRAVAGHLARPLELVATEWDGILAGLLAGKYDLIIGSMAVTEEREQQVDFTDAYYVSGAQLFIHKRSADHITGITDCADRRIGVVLGETYEHFLRTAHPDIECVTYKSTVDIFADLAAGRLSGFVSDRLVGLWQIKHAEQPFVAAGELLYRETIAIPVRQDRPELLANVNRALQSIRASGEWDRIYEKWFVAQRTAQHERIHDAAAMGRMLRGFGVTLQVAVIALTIGFLTAVPVGIVLNRSGGILRTVLRGAVDFIRGTPVLIQLFFVYFGGSQIGINLTPITAAILTLAINCTAYMAEVVRSGLMSVDPGQQLAGEALGFSRWQTFRLIIWPQAFRVALPPLLNSVIALTKDTALVSVISVGEVIREAQSLISITFNPIKFYLIAAALFFAVTYPLMILAGRVEARMKERGFIHD